jgi:hypothetical protein
MALKKVLGDKDLGRKMAATIIRHKCNRLNNFQSVMQKVVKLAAKQHFAYTHCLKRKRAQRAPLGSFFTLLPWCDIDRGDMQLTTGPEASR